MRTSGRGLGACPGRMGGWGVEMGCPEGWFGAAGQWGWEGWVRRLGEERSLVTGGPWFRSGVPAAAGHKELDQRAHELVRQTASSGS